MSKEIEQLSKNLASGVSRRKALWQFAIGAAGLGFLATKKASAQNPFVCFELLLETYSACLTEEIGLYNSNPPAGPCANSKDPNTWIAEFCSGEAYGVYEQCL